MIETKNNGFPDEMLCQDCLIVRPFTDDGHDGYEHCECGGDFCGCSGCQGNIKAINQKEQGL